ncbi:hypothetical protein YTPLAS18_05450 [Nitrospira sp.]|nr:hypothetical protein YTPLAS18_05450 [Nitrospira sp.]
MKVFICWSGRRSKIVAEAVHLLLPRVLKRIKPTYSPDISKGELWFSAVSRVLSRSQAGVVCLTPENFDSVWLHFEAGALVRETRKIFTLLYRTPSGALSGPLSHFQGTEMRKEDMWRLVESLARAMGRAAPAHRVRLAAFEKHWPEFESRLRAIGSLTIEEIVPKLGHLFRRKTYVEPLARCKNQRWIARYDGARDTLSTLRQWRDRVHALAAPYVADLYDDLIQTVDGYAMEMASCVLQERTFKRRANGELNIEGAARDACERRRKRILSLVNDLGSDQNAPVLDDAREYRGLETFPEKKLIIRRLEQEITNGRIPEGLSPRGLVSPWELDRIGYYLVQEHRTNGSLDDVLTCVTNELTIVRARDEEGSLVPLHYAIRALEHWIRHARKRRSLSADVISEVKRAAGNVERFLREQPTRDAGRHIRENLVALRESYRQ